MISEIPTTTIPQPDPFQQRVIDAVGRSIRVVAPAGSGKTETLARRVEARIAAGVPAHRILVLTFDRNAAESFRSKLRSSGSATARVETLNAYGYGLLRSRFPDERNRVITEPFWPNTKYLNDLVNDYGHQVFGSMLSKIKNEVFDPRAADRKMLGTWIAGNRVHLLRDLDNEEIVARVDDDRFGHDLATEFLMYEQFLQQRGGIDFDDQKLRPLIRLRQDRTLLEELQGAFDEIVVDEFQDINRLDAELIDLLSPQATLVVTGDDDQAIYGFRGASAEYLIDPASIFGRPFEHFELSINYRCPPRIIDVAGKLIAHNDTRIDKHPRAAKDLPGTVETISAKNAIAEAVQVARRARILLQSPDGESRTVAILTRTNAQALEVQSALIRATTPYTVPVEQDIRVTWELARRMLLLAPSYRKSRKLTPDDRATIAEAFARAWRLPQGQASAFRREAAASEGAFPDKALVERLPERMRVPFSNGLKALRAAKKVPDEIGALEEFLRAVVSRAMDGGRKASAQSRLGGLRDMAGRFGNRRDDFLGELDRLISLQREALRQPGAPTVTISTCHGAKGKEWQVVFVPFCNAGIFPDARSTEGPYLEAERKLFYVSMTRASEHLVLSWAQFRPDTGRVQEPSPFLVEIGVADPPKRRGQKPTTGAPRTSRTSSSYTPSLPIPGAVRPAPKPSAARSGATRLKRNLVLVSPRSRMTADGTDPRKVVNLADRIEGDEERYGLPFNEMTIRYQPHDVEATLPLQLDLALRHIPFHIDADHRFAESEVFRSMVRAWQTGAQPVSGSLGADTIAAMQAVLQRHTGDSSPRGWQQRLDRVTDAEPGSDDTGVAFLPV